MILAVIYLQVATGARFSGRFENKFSITAEKRLLFATQYIEQMPSDGTSSSNVSAIQQSRGQNCVQERVVALYETHRNGIYRFLVGQGLSPMAAQDLTQDVFVDLFVALEKGTQVSSEQGWLYTVAGRSVADHWRREYNSVSVEAEYDPRVAGDVPSPEISPETQVANKQQIERVAAGLRQLPKEQRLCIHLRMQGLRYREIAKILGVSTSTAAEWICDAVKRLRRVAND